MLKDISLFWERCKRIQILQDLLWKIMILNTLQNPSEVFAEVADVFQINYRKLSHYQTMTSRIKKSCHIICEK